jgi:hypothetical protein
VGERESDAVKVRGYLSVFEMQWVGWMNERQWNVWWGEGRKERARFVYK